MKKVIFIILILLSNTLIGGDAYILHINEAPGIVQYWFIDINGRYKPLLNHQIKNNTYKHYKIIERNYLNY